MSGRVEIIRYRREKKIYTLLSLAPHALHIAVTYYTLPDTPDTVTLNMPTFPELSGGEDGGGGEKDSMNRVGGWGDSNLCGLPG